MKYFSAACIVAVLSLSACSTGADSTSGTKTTLTVFAAASLTEVFADVAEEFTQSEPDMDVRFSFAGSSDLAAQISEGAPADVIATADAATMGTLAGDGLLDGEPTVFAANTLTLAVPTDNPGNIESSQDFAGKDLVVCAPQVPCGADTPTWAAHNDVSLEPVSEENSVTDVLGKVSAGQADAGIVYVTDLARADGNVEEVKLDGADKVVNDYPAATVETSENKDEADAFVDFLQSKNAARTLDDAGFTTH